VSRLWRWLAGDEGPGQPALPVSELLAPVPLAAALVLAGNDWLLKPSAAPGWLTGKLSDVAGLVVTPLLLTALVDLALHAAFRLGARVDFTLRAWKLGAAIAVVGAAFAATKLSPAAAGLVAGALAGLALAAVVTDLVGLTARATAAEPPLVLDVDGLVVAGAVAAYVLAAAALVLLATRRSFTAPAPGRVEAVE
jgi:hypothetical protein